MQGFSISESCRQLVDQYPTADLFGRAILTPRQSEREGLIRLWLSEGIPFAFRSAPMLYECIRNWIAARLAIHPKLVTITGSSRLGYSLAPRPEYGTPFGPHSDLDFTAVSEVIFSQLVVDFERWRSDLTEGRIRPEKPLERVYWPQNISHLPNTIGRGFLYPNKIPYRDNYPTAQKMGQAMFELKTKIASTQDVPTVCKATIRIYRDWDAFVMQMNRNLLFAVRGAP